MNTARPVKQVAVWIVLFVLSVLQILKAQGSAGSDGKIEPRYLIDLPTAGILSHGSLALDMDFFQSNGLLVTVSAGVFNRLVIGASYGGVNIVGTEKAVWNNIPGFNIKLRLIEETIFIPAIALGFDSQGKELYIDHLSRYTIKSMGLYAVVSKNYQALGYLSFHGGVNYSFERSDDDKDPNLFGGVEKSVGPIASLVAEYSLGANDSNHDALGRGRGYLNIGIKASLGKGFTLGLNLKDILKNQEKASIANRTMQLEYVQTL